MHLLALTLTILVARPTHATPVVLSNVALRLDTAGRVVNAHDGGLYALDGKYWLYGTVYENCSQAGPVCDGHCGYFGNVFAAYSSPDLLTWTLESSNVLPELSRDNDKVSYWEANVGYNAATQHYIMLYWSGHYGFVNSSVAVATASSPSGPFVNAPPIRMHGARIISDTVALFVDDDGVAYARYNTRDAPLRHIVERLAPDWLSSSGEYGEIWSKQDFPWYDGGGMFKRGATYYVMLSFDCCFCSWGSDALVFTAPAPLGPWTPQTPRAAAAVAQVPASLPAPRAAASGVCNFSGAWSGVLAGHPIGPPELQLAFSPVDGAVRVSGAASAAGHYVGANASIVFPSFPGYAAGMLVGLVSAFGGSANPCSRIDWLDFTPAGSYWCRHQDCGVAPVPPANWTNEVNPCADGRNPPEGVADMHINPCSQDAVYGTNFTIPAQQFNVAVLTGVSTSPNGNDTALLFFGEHFKSAVDGLKMHDLQAWVPLQFDEEGRLLPMKWSDEFTLYVGAPSTP